VLPFSHIPHVNGQIVLNVMSGGSVESADVDETDMLHKDSKGFSKAGAV
jgi:hypothetical protein